MLKNSVLSGLAFAMLVGVSSLAMGCSSSPCDGSSKCSADPKPTDNDKKTCQALLDNEKTCKSELDKYAACQRDKQVCGSDNKTDSAKTAEACKSEAEAYTKCKAGGATS